MFVDLKAAFDNVDRETLWRILREKGIKERILRRLQNIYEETTVMVRTKNGLTEKFATKKGVRQGCVSSPLLFNVYIADIDKEMCNRGIGGIAIGKSRI